jgi:hypothetical protein
MATKAKIKKMLDLRKLLQDEGLRTKLLDARDEKEVGRLLNAAGKGKGYTFPADWLGDLFVDVKSTRWPPVFTEQELLLLASSRMECDTTTPKTCHTDSCGGGHAGCC